MQPATSNQKPVTISFWHPVSLICTCFGIGKVPFAPGTWGSIPGLLILEKQSPYFVPVIIIFFIIGILASNKYQKITGKSDASEIVIDEVVGQMITVFVAVSIVAAFNHNPQLSELCGYCFLIAYIIMFATFRFFDIVKPYPISWVDKNVKGGLGVMLDDILAGIAAGVTSALIFLAL